MRMFEARSMGAEYGTILCESTPHEEGAETTEVSAVFLRLEGDSAVFLERTTRVTCIQADDAIVSKQAEFIEPGDRLIIVSPEAREVISARILGAKRQEENNTPADQAIKQWQLELAQGLEAAALSRSELLRRIQKLGSRRVTPAVVGQWLSGEVLGPLDATDIRRVGEVLNSEWLLANWERVGFALTLVRSGHRALGHRVTQIIQRAAVGDLELSENDRMFLDQLGITMGKLEDAVMVLSVADTVKDAGLVSLNRIGKVIPA
jgi:hypothetical protein